MPCRGGWAALGGLPVLSHSQPLSPSRGRCKPVAVFVLLTELVISEQHTQEVLSGIVHPNPDLYRKKGIKSHPSTSNGTSCLRAQPVTSRAGEAPLQSRGCLPGTRGLGHEAAPEEVAAEVVESCLEPEKAVHFPWLL